MKNFLRVMATSLLLAQSAMAQQTLTTSPFRETFDNLGSGLPTGFTVRTGAKADVLGTPAVSVLTTPGTNTGWSNSTGGFKNFASATGLASNTVTADQASASNRALGVRQTGSIGDPGAAFVFQVDNTINKTGFALKFKLQSLDATNAPRTATWRVDYGTGATPTFTEATATGTLTTGGNTFSNNEISVNFGQALNNSAEPVWIRIVALAATTGSGNRPSSAIDDFELSWNSATNGPPTLAVSPAALDFGTQNTGTASEAKSYTLSAFNLIADNVTVSTAAPFAVAKTATGDYSTSLTYTAAELNNGTRPVYVRFSPTTSGAAQGTITTSGGGAEAQTVSVSGNGFDPNVITKISTIQGAGAAAVAGTYNVEAIVTGVYATLNPAGFYVQEEDADSDGNVNTSEAIFVAQAGATVAVGDKVKVTGVAQENNFTPSFNQAVLRASAVTVVSSSNPLPTFTTLVNTTYSAAEAEKYEGMLVQFTGPLTVADVSNVRSFGELKLSTNGPVYQPTQVIDPNDNPASGTTSTGATNVAAVKAYELANTNKTIVLDDGSAASNPLPTPYLDPTLQTVRVNSTVSNVKGILGYGFNNFRIQPLAGPGNAPVITVARPAVPTFAKLDVKLASFNVLNYFNGDGLGGGFPTSRGAHTAAEFALQRSKIIKALTEMNADVVGLIEIENDGTGPNSAIQDLVNGLNTALGGNIYSIINDGATEQRVSATLRPDFIRCAIIYKSAVVKPVGDVLLSPDPVFDRPPIAQVFTLAATPDTFTYVVNHFKSKGSGKDVNADQGDGQAASNFDRKAQAQALLNFFSTTVIPAGNNNIVSVGDYNAYFEEDPLDIFRAADLNVTGSPQSISYVFEGQSGALDHVVTSAQLAPLTTVKKWNINAEEPLFLQYGQPGGAADANSPFRSSDHDPILIALDFPTVIQLTDFTAVQSGNKIKLAWTVVEPTTREFVVERSLDGKVFQEVARVKANSSKDPKVAQYSAMDFNPTAGTTYYRLKQLDADGTSIYSAAVAATFDGNTTLGGGHQLVVHPNPVVDQLHMELTGEIAHQQVFKLDLAAAQDGHTVLTAEGTMSALQTQINAAAARLMPGVYILRLVSANGVFTQRVIKQ